MYEGSSLTPFDSELESYPALDLLDQERLIITFPLDSGLPPILVVFKSPRYEPGVATGSGSEIEGIWLGEISRNTGALVPIQIANTMRGKSFSSFDTFRSAFWNAVANTPELAKQFNKINLNLMSKGYAPRARDNDHHKSLTTFILHHQTPISEGGAVYDIDNIRIVTPQAHNNIHYGAPK
ncbi:S-type pyocin domain-containing protein [Pseudomonas sp. PSKL.D1]|uniref:S-type pyocin domain-containing protein n=1 Tax=Pseudomonas sp. PSKL.D1 TaxID=3029060 RepID=UPI0023814880|nr:S-type pyocin domain-containing protein [Pseudomonas sp. PSKL.D1]WDY58873.1 S-type pyocin domain-containing protein [Pseudomonas sp. PSKL.D1]